MCFDLLGGRDEAGVVGISAPEPDQLVLVVGAVHNRRAYAVRVIDRLVLLGHGVVNESVAGAGDIQVTADHLVDVV